MLSRSILRTISTRLPITASAIAIPSARMLIHPINTNFNTISKRSYHEKVIDHYENPRNVGTLNKNDADVGTGLVGAPACGDVMRLQIKVNPDSGIIEDVKFKTFGCGSAIASSSYVTELVKGKTLDEALKIKNTVIAKELSLPPVKLHCSMLAEDAIKSAVKDYKSKRLVKQPTLGAQVVVEEAAIAN
ncbi:NifU-like N terminal domain-containing protein [Scheffersomyces amazonensis]|uniref:NifU-like N terminal domain-containing protein n=1 Tax=Scheffersomyces amazonensis TaxID=1078765 RepID=UPI00315D272C